MSLDLVVRLTVMLAAAALGWEVGRVLASLSAAARGPLQVMAYQGLAATLAGGVGFAAGPWLTARPYARLRNRLAALPPRTLVLGLVGAFVGLALGALLAVPLAMLPGAVGTVAPLVGALPLAGLGAVTLVRRDREVLSVLGLAVGQEAIKRKRNVVLLDTSVIIDGRIADVARTGFVAGVMLVPRFVLDELQRIADSPDVLRRNRGRRGLDILNTLQKDSATRLEISAMDAPDVPEVDGKLVALARRLDCPILTNDYNLNRVAELQGVSVLNVNELANAVKVVVLPGEVLNVQIIQDGKEVGQGVAYLDDGTMVVVEEGRRLMGQSVDIVVTRVLQTVAGRMVFGHPQNGKR
jgi:uncharacterized protein YacL